MLAEDGFKANPKKSKEPKNVSELSDVEAALSFAGMNSYLPKVNKSLLSVHNLTKQTHEK